MSHTGLNRRAFLQNAGMTAVLGALGNPTSTARAEAAGGLEPLNGKYDFDTIYSRIGTDCVRWDQQIKTYGKDSLAVGMGIADMDFRAAPAITRALNERLQHENWGYLSMPTSYTESIVNWNKRRYGTTINPDLMLLSSGVHPALIAALQTFSPRGSKILVQSPTYNAFYTDINLVGCKAEENPLKLVNGRYAMDFDDLERRIDHDTNTLILCNPQNPTGNCWSAEDLTRLGEICLRRRVIVLADEIHCDFVNKGQKYTPFANLPNKEIVRNSISFKSASKSFCLAAMKCAYMFSDNPDYMARIKAAGYRTEINTLGMVANRAAYNESEDWLDQAVAYIDSNHEFVESFVRANIPLIKCVKPEGTYLAWLDVSDVIDRIGAKAAAEEANRKKEPSAPVVTPTMIVEKYLVKHAKVHVNAGAGYGRGGEARMRMNVATSRKLVELALTNIANALKNPPVSTL
jgi:cysteine-S-conjugate beta-lyase